MNAYVLKLIALVTMLIDHVGYVFMDNNIYMRIIGRIAFPLYALMVVDGCLHLAESKTGLKKYFGFLTTLAIICEPLYDYAFFSKWTLWSESNQIIQFLTFVIVFAMCKKLNNNYAKAVAWLGTVAVNEYFHMGYGGAGILLMLFFMWYLQNYQNKSTQWRMAVITGAMLLFIVCYTSQVIMPMAKLQYFFKNLLYCLFVKPWWITIMTVVAIPFLACYNGSYGSCSVKFKNFYKWFYPAHLAIICMVKFAMEM